MSDTFRSIGTVAAVSATLPATINVTGYEALTFTAIGGVSTVGEFGATYGQVTHTDLADGEVQKDYGELNAGDPSLTYRIIPADAGQAIMTTAESNLAKVALKVTRPNGLIQYAVAIVQGSPVGEASAANASTVTVTLGCNSYVKDASGV